MGFKIYNVYNKVKDFCKIVSLVVFLKNKKTSDGLSMDQFSEILVI